MVSVPRQPSESRGGKHDAKTLVQLAFKHFPDRIAITRFAIRFDGQ